HEPLLDFRDASGDPVRGDTNPLIYQIVMAAKGRLLQIEAGLNYLGYPDDYVPPWRFTYLLERARYFTEHAKRAPSDYLNYLSNAEREEFQELSAEQKVAEERQNIRAERARVEQSRDELKAAEESEELADLAANDAHQRLADHDPLEIGASLIVGAGS